MSADPRDYPERCDELSNTNRACCRDKGHDGDHFFDVVVPRRQPSPRDARAEVIDQLELSIRGLERFAALTHNNFDRTLSTMREAAALLRKEGS